MKRFLVVTAVLLFYGVANAQTAAPADAQKIRALLSSMFDKPDLKVVADPIVVAGQHAVASWTQGEMGGRALLLKKDDKWGLVACAGDGLKDAQGLESAGMPKDFAVKLAQQLALAEAKVPANRRGRFSLFGPTVDARTAHAPDASHTH